LKNLRVNVNFQEIISHGELRLPNWKEASISVRMDKYGDASKNRTYETPDSNNGIGFEQRPWIDLDGKLLTTSCHNQKVCFYLGLSVLNQTEELGVFRLVHEIRNFGSVLRFDYGYPKIVKEPTTLLLLNKIYAFYN